MFLIRSILISLLASTAACAGNSVSGDVNIDVSVNGGMVAENGRNMIGVVTNSNVSGSVSINAVVGSSVVTKDGETSIACVNGWSGGSVRIQVYLSSVINLGAGTVNIGCRE